MVKVPKASPPVQYGMVVVPKYKKAVLMIQPTQVG